jgi:hypothetical protein
MLISYAVTPHRYISLPAVLTRRTTISSNISYYIGSVYERAASSMYVGSKTINSVYNVARHSSCLNTCLEAFGLEETLRQSVNVASVGSPVRGEALRSAS